MGTDKVVYYTYPRLALIYDLTIHSHAAHHLLTVVLWNLRSKRSTSCFSAEICDDVRVMYSSSSRRDQMFIERRFKKILLAPEERNGADLAYSSPQHRAPLERESSAL